MKLSIVIPVHNNVNFTKSCLLDLLKLPDDHEVIIVNNASTDGTFEMLEDMKKRYSQLKRNLKVIHADKNLGFGKANNLGYVDSVGQNVLFLNNDIRVREDHEDWTDILIEQCELGHMVSANGGLLNSDFRFIKETDHYVDDRYFYLSGWCLAASRKVFDNLTLRDNSMGPWNEKFFAYYEDDDLSWRAQEQGIELKVIPVPVIHFGRMTSKKLGLGDIFEQSYYIFKDLWEEKRGQK